ncbi:MAG: acyl-CoA/acyl-ACP dehydrogenase, partial [Pseudomonadales bacterium]|nr:acyl-CoA/acyl-ACP dehydrogenase [Pseudomonadales bacterium]
ALLETASLMTRKAAWAHDAGENAGEFANIAKFTAAEANFKAADAALQVHGGYGFTESMDMLDHFIGARLGKVAPINREMNLNFIGEHILGMPKSY